MGLYERFVDGVKVGRAFTVDGTDEDREYAELADVGREGWQRADTERSTRRRRQAE